MYNPQNLGISPLARAHSKNLFSRTFCTSREYGDYGNLEIEGMANTSSAISRLQIDEIEQIQEYNYKSKSLKSIIPTLRSRIGPRG